MNDARRQWLVRLTVEGTVSALSDMDAVDALRSTALRLPPAGWLVTVVQARMLDDPEGPAVGATGGPCTARPDHEDPTKPNAAP